jgi:hypothetical protein
MERTTSSSARASGRILMSYRRQETAYATGWLFDRLAERYGRLRSSRTSILCSPAHFDFDFSRLFTVLKRILNASDDAPDAHTRWLPRPRHRPGGLGGRDERRGESPGVV